LHVENYGSSRDAEGRLVWGINDFDEAGPPPYTNDLVRLATSAWLAIEIGSLGDRLCCRLRDDSGGLHRHWKHDFMTRRVTLTAKYSPIFSATSSCVAEDTCARPRRSRISRSVMKPAVLRL